MQSAAKEAVVETNWRIYPTFNHGVAKPFSTDDLPVAVQHNTKHVLATNIDWFALRPASRAPPDAVGDGWPCWQRGGTMSQAPQT